MWCWHKQSSAVVCSPSPRSAETVPAQLVGVSRDWSFHLPTLQDQLSRSFSLHSPVVRLRVVALLQIVSFALSLSHHISLSGAQGDLFSSISTSPLRRQARSPAASRASSPRSENASHITNKGIAYIHDYVTDSRSPTCRIQKMTSLSSKVRGAVAATFMFRHFPSGFCPSRIYSTSRTWSKFAHSELHFTFNNRKHHAIVTHVTQ